MNDPIPTPYDIAEIPSYPMPLWQWILFIIVAIGIFYVLVRFFKKRTGKKSTSILHVLTPSASSVALLYKEITRLQIVIPQELTQQTELILFSNNADTEGIDELHKKLMELLGKT